MIRGYCLIFVWANLIMTASTVLTDYADIENHTSQVVSQEGASDPTYAQEITQLLRGDFIFAHNVVRSSTDPIAINMVFMVWSLRLEKIAKLAVKGCGFKGSLNDDDLEELHQWFSSGGLNSWFGEASKTLNVSKVVGNWSAEKDFFDYRNLGCELGRRCMHYAQIVWATASHVGCALKFCPKFTDQAMNELVNQHYVICVYGEGGTKLTKDGDYKFPYHSGNQSCLKCPTGFIKCRDGLCDTNPQCETVVDCASVNNPKLCLCDESVYSRGQRSIVPVWTSLEAVVISVIFMSSSGYAFI